MKRKILGILDIDEDYAMNLVAFMNQRNHGECEMRGFSSLEHLADYLENEQLDLLLVSENIEPERVKELNVEKVIILSEYRTDGETGHDTTDDSGKRRSDIQDAENNEPDYSESEQEGADKPPTVYKYQSAQLLVREVMTYYAKMEALQMSRPIRLENMEMIAVYSPGDPCARMKTALAIAQEKAITEPVLYMNFEEYSGISKQMNLLPGGDLSDLIYFYRHQKNKLKEKLDAIVQTREHVDIVPPIMSGGDLHQIDAEEWKALLEELAAVTHYRYFVLDIGNSVGQLTALLELCSTIYIPRCEEEEAVARVDEFREHLEYCGQQKLVKKICLVSEH